MTENLKNIVSESYSLFRDYKVSVPLDICTDCCVTKNQESELVSMDVKHIPFDLLYKYNTAAKAIKPSIEEFKHFLPRFLELTADKNFLHHSAELILNRFMYHSKDEWTLKEQDLIVRYSTELFKEYLSQHPLPEVESIDAIIKMLNDTKVNVLPILENWFSIKTRSSVLHLSDLICNGFISTNYDKFHSQFVDDTLYKTVFKWINNDVNLAELKPIIEEMIMNPGDLGEWQLTELNWMYNKLNELDHKKNHN